MLLINEKLDAHFSALLIYQFSSK